MSLSLWDDTDTLALCAADPNLEAMRHLLLQVERDAHQRGWNKRSNITKLFEVKRDDDLLTLRMAGVLQTALDERIKAHDGNAGLAMLDIARAVERARQLVSTSGGAASALKDLHGTGTGTLYGWGLLSEVWLGYRKEDWTPERKKAFDQAMDDRKLSKSPERIEARMIYMVGRDGYYWAVMRHRGEAPIAVVIKPESLKLELQGNIAHALGRMVNAIASNPVPVPARGESFWKQQGGG